MQSCFHFLRSLDQVIRDRDFVAILILKRLIPVDTRRRFNVYKTSIRRCRRRVSTGMVKQI